jgi:hydroxypyruvate reductase
LILSDVIGDQIDTIGSGPTAPDPSTYKDALAIVDRYSLEGEMPPAVLSRLHQGRQGKHSETPKSEDPIFDSVSNFILASNHDALQAGAAQADQEGYSVNTLPGFLTGEACQAGKKLAEKLTKIALQDQLLPRPVCLIAGGETSVTMTNTKKPGQGGRNLETALCALLELDGLDNIILITLATDGEDGLTTAAGAVVTEKSYNRCRQLGLNPTEYLARHDSFTLFKALDDLLITGPTGTNVNDLCFLFAF